MFLHFKQKSAVITDFHSVKRGEFELDFPPTLSTQYHIDSSGSIFILDRNNLVKFTPSDFTDENGCNTYRADPIRPPVDVFSCVAGSPDRIILGAASGRVYIGKYSESRCSWVSLGVSQAPLTALALHPTGLFAATTDTLGSCRIISLYEEKDHVSMYIDAKKVSDNFSDISELPLLGGVLREFPVHAWVSDVSWSPCGLGVLVTLRVGGFFVLSGAGLVHHDCVAVLTGGALLDDCRAVLTTEKCGELLLDGKTISDSRCPSTAARRRVAVAEGRVGFTTCTACGDSRSISL